jgi:hypothetical protein
MRKRRAKRGHMEVQRRSPLPSPKLDGDRATFVEPHRLVLRVDRPITG